MTPIIETHSITKIYHKIKVIDDVSIEILPGQVVGLVGSNGAGKTTLFRILSGLIIPNSGEVAYSGEKKGKAFDLAKTKIGVTIDAPSLYPRLSARDNIKAYALGRNLKINDSAISEALHTVGLEDNQKVVRNFSMGMKQRLSIAMALFGGCKVIMLDEPFNGLDPIGLKQISDQIRAINREKNITFVIASHNLAELEELCDRFVFLENGKIIKRLSKSELEKKEQRIISFLSSEENRVADFFKQNSISYRKEGGRFFVFYDDDPLNLIDSMKQNSLSMHDLSISKENLMDIYSKGRVYDE